MWICIFVSVTKPRLPEQSVEGSTAGAFLPFWGLSSRRKRSTSPIVPSTPPPPPWSSSDGRCCLLQVSIGPPMCLCSLASLSAAAGTCEATGTNKELPRWLRPPAQAFSLAGHDSQVSRLLPNQTPHLLPPACVPRIT